MSNAFDVKAGELVKLVAEKLKGSLKQPAYVSYAKSGADRERPPQDKDFWFMRSASILRQVYVNGPIGVSALRTRYGSKKEHTVHRHHHLRAGGSMIRDALAGLEEMKLVKRTKKGRVITPEGKSFLDKASSELSGARAQ